MITHKKNLCAKRLDLNYFNMSLTDSKTNCNSDYKTCGVIDSFGNRLCLPKEKECPKTFKEIQSESNNFFKDYASDMSIDFLEIKNKSVVISPC